MSSLTRWVNKDFKLIKQTCRIPVTWHHLREYRIWTILANSFMLINSLRPRQNGRHFADDTFKHILAATKQLYKWYFPSVCPSVRPSVCLSVTPFWLCSHHRIIMKFSGVITNDKSDVHAKGQGQRSRSQRSQPNLNRHQTIWVYMWKNWKEQCRIRAYITINRTKCYCSKLSIRLVITTKTFFNIRYAT